MTVVAQAADIEALLAPVGADAPAGTDLRYQPLYDEIKAARKQAEDDPTETAPWGKVAELAVSGMSRSKDLQLGIWLLEAWARIDGFTGAASGLLVVRRLLEEFWDSVFPLIDAEDSEPLGFRRSLLEWVDERLPLVLNAQPLTGPPSSYGLVHYEVTQKSGDVKKALQDEGWPSYEQFDEALKSSATAHLEAVVQDVSTCQGALASLQAVVDARFNAPAPGAAGGGPREPLRFLVLKEALETASWLVTRVLQKRTQAAEAEGTADQSSPGAAQPAGTTIGPGAPSAVDGDQLWAQALTLTRDSRVDGLRMLQAEVAATTCGRDRFLRELQLAELGLEAGVHSLALPVFDELARTIDARKLDEWEEKRILARVWSGLARCCALLKARDEALAARESESLDRLAQLDGAERT